MLRATALCLCALAVAHNAATAQSAPPGIPLFPDCDKPDLLAHGRPMMMLVGPHLGMGISIAKDTFHAGEPIRLNVWADNQADTPAGVDTCWDLDLFKSRGFEILDRDGNRILSREGARACNADPGVASLWVCHRSFPIPIPAHSCVTDDDYDFSINLADHYDLPPGEYTLRLRPKWREMQHVCESEESGPFHRQPGDLTFTVTP